MSFVVTVQKKRILAGTWAGIGFVGGVVAYRRLRDFETRAPAVDAALRRLEASEAARQVLGEGPLTVGYWPRQSHVEKFAGLSRASFKAYGPNGHFVHVLVGARREVEYQEAWEDKEDEDVEVSALKYYWMRPWELKRAAVDKIKHFRKGVTTAVGIKEEKDDLSGWQIDTLVFLPSGDHSSPQVLQGNPMSLPDYEALCLRRDAGSKDEHSRRRLHNVLCLFAVGAALLGGQRLLKSFRISRSYGHVRRSVLSNQDVLAVLGPTANIQNSTGTFTTRYIDAHLRLVGNKGAVADIDIAAIRDKGGEQPWRIALARMKVGGCLYNLHLQNFGS